MLRLTLVLALILLLLPVAYAVPNRIPAASQGVAVNVNAISSSSTGSFSVDNISGLQFSNGSYSISPADMGDVWPDGNPGKPGTFAATGFHPGFHGRGGDWPGKGRGGWPGKGHGGGGDNPAAVPEPTTLLLFGMGLMGAGIVRKVRQG
jgi:hypothetical protein